MPEGPIRLQRGADNPNARHGEYHLENSHGKDIRGVGFSNARDFVEDTVRGATEVWKQPNGRFLLVKKNGKDHLAIVEFQKEGSFYGIKTAFPTSNTSYPADGGRTRIYRGRPLGSLQGEK